MDTLAGVCTYHELHDSALRLAGSLAELGVRPGEVFEETPRD